MNQLLGKVLFRTSLVGSSLLQGRSFWAQAALGRNQMYLHECGGGEISIGKVKEQFYSEGFIAAYHQVLERELGSDKAREILMEFGTRGAAWEISEAIRHGIWVPRFLHGLVGTTALFEKVRSSGFLKLMMTECMRLLFRMIMTEGGWGVIDEIEIAADPMYIKVHNTPEYRQLAPTGSPSCHIMCGIYRAYFQELFNVDCDATEVACQSTGAPQCVFTYANPRPRVTNRG